MEEENDIPFTMIVQKDGELRFSGVVKKRGVSQKNAEEVLKAFYETFKDGELVDVVIKRRN